jgi:hypothetical protein
MPISSSPRLSGLLTPPRRTCTAPHRILPSLFPDGCPLLPRPLPLHGISTGNKYCALKTKGVETCPWKPAGFLNGIITMKDETAYSPTRLAKHSLLIICTALVLALLPERGTAQVQVVSGSDGHDGALNPVTNIVINMADHPDGIYHYTSVNIPSGVTVTFIRNSSNKPVTWLVETNCIIDGTVDVSGTNGTNGYGGIGGPGGGRGGNGGPSPTMGEGIGAGNDPTAGLDPASQCSCGSFATAGRRGGPLYGNEYVLPLQGGSGGTGYTNLLIGAGGGSGAILIAASGEIQLNASGLIRANGGSGESTLGIFSGDGSGGAVRLVATRISGHGTISASGGGIGGGNGWIRIDAIDYMFVGTTHGVFTHGYQPVILLTAGQSAQLVVSSVGGVSLPPNPSGVITTPDAVISAQQSSPMPVVVSCMNLPLHTAITVTARPVNGPPVSAVGYNDTGNAASSTATVVIAVPRGGGQIYATAGVAK